MHPIACLLEIFYMEWVQTYKKEVLITYQKFFNYNKVKLHLLKYLDVTVSQHNNIFRLQNHNHSIELKNIIFTDLSHRKRSREKHAKVICCFPVVVLFTSIVMISLPFLLYCLINSLTQVCHRRSADRRACATNGTTHQFRRMRLC